MTTEMTSTADETDSGGDLVEAIRDDHQGIKSLLRETAEASTDDARKDAFQRLVERADAHEAAEQELVHPVARKAPQGDVIVGQLLEQEAAGKKAFAELEQMGSDDPKFVAAFISLRADVEAHAEEEERDEHPKLLVAADEQELADLGKAFRDAIHKP